MTPKKEASVTPQKSPSRRLNMSMPKALLAEVDAVSKQTGLTRSEVVAAILAASLPSDSNGPHVCPRGHIRPCDEKAKRA